MTEDDEIMWLWWTAMLIVIIACLLVATGCTAPGTVSPEAFKALVDFTVASDKRVDESIKAVEAIQRAGRDAKSIIDQRTYDSDRWINRGLLIFLGASTLLGSAGVQMWCRWRRTCRRRRLNKEPRPPKKFEFIT